MLSTKHLLANFSIGHAKLIDPSYLRMTGKLDKHKHYPNHEPVKNHFINAVVSRMQVQRLGTK
jgi:hypothetical protein